MADVTLSPPPATSRSPERVGLFAGPPVRISWGAIFGGTVSALAIWALLYALGLALGFSSIDQNNPGSLKSSGVFTGIWGIFAPVVALFIGALVASRAAGVMSRAAGAIHGLVVWGVATLVGAWLVVTLLAAILGGAFSLGKTAVEAGGQAVAGVVSGAADVGGGLADAGSGLAAGTFELDPDDALGPINQRLVAAGQPAVTPEALQAALKDVIQEASSQGRLDRELLVRSLAEKNLASPADAEEIATRVEAQFSAAKAEAKEKAASAAEAAKTAALKQANITGKAFWAIFAVFFLGLVAAILGATAGVSKRQRLWA